ncbi:hypothetical protein THAOC_22845 [Thalassiosira oceanica]|uniref:Uncharacterized protein n=1 Tax=Thalassiosira oceanica TaxID=159749 RepID=K0RXH9_THAOC|nr:hypothetical protein THAOC_22845 [Thalassiosira oceanica]|eukprot:EJK57144.1 hypothetical protein THAOC_22845 [Thalassiosira oceanica]
MHSNPPTSTVEEEEYIDSSGRIAYGSSRPPLAFSSPFLPPRDPDAVRGENEEAMVKANKYAASVLSPRHAAPYAHAAHGDDDDNDRGHDQQQAERDPSTTTGGRRLLRRRRLGENRGSPEQAFMPPLPGVEPSETSAFDVVCLHSPVRGRIRPQHEREEDDHRQHEDQHAKDVDIIPAAGSSSVSTPNSPCSSPYWETLGDDAYRLTDRQRRKVWEIVEEEAQDRLASESVAKRSWKVALLAVAALPLLLPLSRTGFPRRIPRHPPAAPPHARFGGPAFIRDATPQASTKADRELLRETASLLARQRRRWNPEQERGNAAVSGADRERARSIARGEAAERLAGLASKVEA